MNLFQVGWNVSSGPWVWIGQLLGCVVWDEWRVWRLVSRLISVAMLLWGGIPLEGLHGRSVSRFYESDKRFGDVREVNDIILWNVLTRDCQVTQNLSMHCAVWWRTFGTWWFERRLETILAQRLNSTGETFSDWIELPFSVEIDHMWRHDVIEGYGVIAVSGAPEWFLFGKTAD